MSLKLIVNCFLPAIISIGEYLYLTKHLKFLKFLLQNCFNEKIALIDENL